MLSECTLQPHVGPGIGRVTLWGLLPGFNQHTVGRQEVFDYTEYSGGQQCGLVRYLLCLVVVNPVGNPASPSRV